MEYLRRKRGGEWDLKRIRSEFITDLQRRLIVLKSKSEMAKKSLLRGGVGKSMLCTSYRFTTARIERPA